MSTNFADSDWDDLKIFLAVARNGTQAFAAETLGQSQPTVGRRIRALERNLGSALFRRTARGLALTEEGMAVLRNVERMESEARAIQLRLSAPDFLSGSMRVSASGWLGSHILAPAFADFSNRHPQVQVHLVAHGPFSSLREDVDLAYQLHEFSAPDFIQRAMMRITYGIYASAAYLGHNGPLRAGGHGHKLVTLAGDAAIPEHDEWLRTHLGHATTVLRTDSHEALIQWCRNGLGLALLPRAIGGMYAGLVNIQLSAVPTESVVWAGHHREMKFMSSILGLLAATQQSMAPSQQ
jgi:DNA-binding transcriptional LysR family regulator